MSVSCSGPTRVRAGGAFGSWRDGPRGIASRSGRVGPFVPCRSRKKNISRNKKEGTKRASALRAAAEGKPSGPSAHGERIVGEVVSRLRPSLSPPRRRRLVSPSLLAKKTPFFSLVRLTSPRAFRSERRDASSSPRPAPARGASESAARVASGDASARGVVEIEKNRQKTPRFVRLASGV